MTITGLRQRTVLAILVGVWTIAPLMSGTATTLERLSLGQMVAVSRAVVRARCLGSVSLWKDHAIWTVTRFQTLETLRGRAPDQFTVQAIGGKVGTIESSVAEAPRFRAGEEVVLFLGKPHANVYGVVAWKEGTFRVTHDAAGEAFVTQESADEFVYDAGTRTFKREGIRRMSLDSFRKKIRGLAFPPASSAHRKHPSLTAGPSR